MTKKVRPIRWSVIPIIVAVLVAAFLTLQPARRKISGW